MLIAGSLYFALMLRFGDYGSYMQFSFVADRFQYLAGFGCWRCFWGRRRTGWASWSRARARGRCCATGVADGGGGAAGHADLASGGHLYRRGCRPNRRGCRKVVLAALPYVTAAVIIVGGALGIVKFLTPDACETVCTMCGGMVDSCAIGCGAGLSTVNPLAARLRSDRGAWPFRAPARRLQAPPRPGADPSGASAARFIRRPVPTCGAPGRHPGVSTGPRCGHSACWQPCPMGGRRGGIRGLRPAFLLAQQNLTRQPFRPPRESSTGSSPVPRPRRHRRRASTR